MALIESEISVREWFDALDASSRALDDHKWSLRRLERLHAIQICTDVVAHAHNVPLRLLRLGRLRDLDGTFVRFVEKWELLILKIMTEHNPDGSSRMPPEMNQAEAQALIAQMKNRAHVCTLRDWVLKLASQADIQERRLSLPGSLPNRYAEWFLMFLPHLERDIWLTEMGNPLPAHNLARMVEHWALFVLMWAWSKSDEMSSVLSTGAESRPVVLERALDIEYLEASVLPVYKRAGRSDDKVDVVMIVGPYVSYGANALDDTGTWFHEPFHRFLARIGRVEGVSGWDEINEKAPGVTELGDALEARTPNGTDDARQRALQSCAAMRELLSARIDNSLLEWPNGKPGRPLSRANWESMSVMACWKARWMGSLLHLCVPKDREAIELSLPRHRVNATLLLEAADGQATSSVLHFHPERVSRDAVSLAEVLATAHRENEWVSIESLVNLNARVRERQQVAWSAYTTAINRLLARHTRRERPEGEDNPAALYRSPPTCEEVDHLMRGFGGRICRYLLGMARADVAELYWMDYSSLPPRLRHVGSAERLVQMRATRQDIWTQFNEEIWSAPDQTGPIGPLPGVALDSSSEFQLYRACALGRIEPSPAERKAKVAQDQPGPRAVTKFYEDLVPLKDYMSVPLIFNSRVIGVMALAGTASNRHFDTRMHPWLHTLAQNLGQSMYFHSQVWQMRQINWLASNMPMEMWQVDSAAGNDRAGSALVNVARCLANIFLCPGVQIWLRDKQNRRRYVLAGCTAAEVYGTAEGPRDRAPSVVLGPGASGTHVPLTRPIFALALDQWETSGTDIELRALRGLFVQAHLDLQLEKTSSSYSAASAQTGDLILGKDFLEDPFKEGPAARDSEAVPGIRKTLFIDRGWRDWMGFALVNDSGGKMQPIGVVSLHSDSVERNGARPLGPSRPMAWPPGWRPVVAHVQTYLPYVLTQTEAIDKPLSQLVQYLLHQGRNELNAASTNAARTKELLQKVLAVDEPPGTVRPWLRNRLRHFEDLPDADLRGRLFQLDQLLAELSRALDSQQGVETAESLTILWNLIEKRRSIAALGHDLERAGDVHRTKWVDLARTIDHALEPFSGDLRRERVFLSKDIEGEWELLTQHRLWGWLLSDLMHNMAKYAAADSGLEVRLLNSERGPSRKPYVLRFINEAVYDAALDDPQQLKTFGVRGSAGLARQQRALVRERLSRVGTGIGLWGVDQLAQTLGLKLELDIRPLSHRPGVARYFFDLHIPVEYLRSR